MGNLGVKSAVPVAERAKVAVFFGTHPRRVVVNGAASEVERHMYCRVRLNTATKLGLPVFKDSDLTRKGKDGQTVRSVGSNNGKKIYVKSPENEHTPGGRTKRYEIMVPSDAPINEIIQFLQTGSGIKQFTVKGGRTYTV